MIDIKKRILSVGLGLVFAVTGTTCVTGDVFAGNGKDADETGKIVESYEIPREMQPLSEIEFISDHEYVIKKGGVATEKEEEESEELEEWIVDAIKDGSWFTAVHCISPPPVKRLKVDYATDGIVSHWKFPKESQDRMIEVPAIMEKLPKIYDKYLKKYAPEGFNLLYFN